MNRKGNTYKTIKLQIISGKATPSSSIGPALGQHGLNIMNFCKEFNKRTEGYEELPVTAIIQVHPNKKYTFALKQTPTSILIKKAMGLSIAKKPGAGSKSPGKQTIGHISRKQLEDIVKIKEKDLNSYNTDSAIKIIAGTAKSMGIGIKS